MATATELRQERGKQLSMMQNAVSRVNETDYIVLSQSGNGQYHVSKTFNSWICQCPDYTFRGLTCKHIYAVQVSFEMRQEVTKRVIEPVSITSCAAVGISPARS